jgi:hypothetical protein
VGKVGRTPVECRKAGGLAEEGIEQGQLQQRRLRQPLRSRDGLDLGSQGRDELRVHREGVERVRESL